MSWFVEKNVPEFMRERETGIARLDTAPIENHNVANARSIARNERLSNATATGKLRNNDHLNRARVAVIDGANQRALFERSRNGIAIDEVLKPVGEINLAHANAHRAIGQRNERDRGQASVRIRDSYICTCIGPTRHAGIDRHDPLETRVLEHALQLHGHVPRRPAPLNTHGKPHSANA